MRNWGKWYWGENPLTKAIKANKLNFCAPQQMSKATQQCKRHINYIKNVAYPGLYVYFMALCIGNFMIIKSNFLDFLNLFKNLESNWLNQSKYLTFCSEPRQFLYTYNKLSLQTVITAPPLRITNNLSIVFTFMAAAQMAVLSL